MNYKQKYWQWKETRCKIMTAEIKDKDKNIVQALNMLGYKIDSRQLELILNVSEFVSKKGKQTTISDLNEMEGLVNGLYKG